VTNKLFEVVKKTSEEEYLLWMSDKGVYWSVSSFFMQEEKPTSYREPPEFIKKKILKKERYIPWSSISSVGSEAGTDDARILIFYLCGLENPVRVPYELTNNHTQDVMYRVMLKIG